MIIRPMTLADYDDVLALMTDTPGVSVRAADSLSAIERYLLRNPGLSLVAEMDYRIVGCVFCGHDGRRGYLYHVVVDPGYRRQGIGLTMVERALEGLAFEGIEKTHIDVFADNSGALAFWQRLGWQLRTDLFRLSFTLSADPNA